MSKEKKKITVIGGVKNENYINVLKNENNELDNKLKKVNELVSKLKSQITENEQEKNLLITTSHQKDKDIEDIKKQLEKTKSQVDELKDQNKNRISSLETQNDILQKNKEMNTNTIAELQKKITDLEFKLKSSSLLNKKFSILSGGHNFSLAIQSSQKKSSEEGLPDIISLKNSETKIDNNDFFLTGRNELLEMRENNEKLKEQLELLQNELNKHENDKKNMMKELEQYNEEKNSLLNTISKKNEEINGKLDKENELNNNLMKQLIENKKIKNNLDNIKIKCNNLEKNKRELEDVIFQQENKVNELSTSVKKIVNMVKIKDIEISNNKIYISNLEETIKDLNKEFHQIRLQKKKDNSQEISNLKSQLEHLKKEYQKLIDNNNNEPNRQMFNYNHISNNQIISRNYNINNFNNENKKIRIKMCLNNPRNKISYNSLNISNIVNINDQKLARVNSQKNIFNDKINNDLNSGNNSRDYFSIHKRKIFVMNNDDSNVKNKKINMHNIRIKNLGNAKYNKIKFNQLKKRVKPKCLIGNNSMRNIKGNILKEEKNESEERNSKRQIKKISSNIFIPKFSESKKNEKFDSIRDENNIMNKPIKLVKKQINFSENEKFEKQKIEEFKNLLEQIVNDIEK